MTAWPHHPSLNKGNQGSPSPNLFGPQGPVPTLHGGLYHVTQSYSLLVQQLVDCGLSLS